MPNPTALRALLLAVTGLVLVAATGGPAPHAAPGDLDRYQTHLASLARDGSWWYASNEAYRAEDGADAPDGYGLRFWLAPGGLAATGCMWAVRDGDAGAPIWHLAQGWDGIRETAWVYQSHTLAPITGMGQEVEADGESLAIEQRFRWADGSTQRLRHEERWIDDDTRADRSFAWEDGSWVQGRGYTWSRRTEGPTACGPT